MLVQMLGLVVLATVVGGDNCAVEPKLMQLLHWEQSGDTLVPVLHEESLTKLSKVAGGIGIMSIIGPYRSGKSHLLNNLLPNEQLRAIRPFTVGHTTKPETETIDLYLIPACQMQMPGAASTTDPSQSVLLLDSPGLFAPNRVDSYDYQTLAFLSLLSSAVIFNNNGIVQRDAVGKFGTSLRLASSLRPQGASEEEQKPALHWVLQNLNLKLADSNGDSITATEFIRDFVDTLDHTGASEMQQSFDQYFEAMEASTVPSPKQDPDETRELEELAPKDFREVYLTAMEELRKTVFKLVKPKEIAGRKLEGDSLVALLRSWSKKIEMPVHSREGFTMQTFASELDKLEHDKLLSFVTDRIRGMNYPVDQAMLHQMRDTVFETMTSSGKYAKTPGFASDMKREIQQVVDNAQSSNLAARARFIMAHTTAIGSAAGTKLPMAPSGLPKMFTGVAEAWIAAAAPASSDDGAGSCGQTDGGSSLFRACTDSASPCCNADTKTCGADVESCTCAGCLDYTNGWLADSGESRKQEVIPELWKALATTQEDVTAQNERLIADLSKVVEDKATEVVATLPLIPSALEGAMNEIKSVVPAHMIEYTPMKEIFEKVSANVEASNVEKLNSVKESLTPALELVRAKFPMSQDSVGPAVEEAVDSRLDSIMKSHFSQHISDEIERLVKVNNQAFKDKETELTGALWKIELPLNDADLITEQDSVFKALTPHPGQDKLLEEKFKSVQEGMKIKNRELIIEFKTAALARWSKMWTRVLVEESAAHDVFEVPEFPSFPGADSSMDFPHAILADEGTQYGAQGRDMYACFVEIVEGIRGTASTEMKDYAARKLPASMSDSAAAVSGILGITINEEGEVNVDLSLAEGDLITKYTSHCLAETANTGTLIYMSAAVKLWNDMRNLQKATQVMASKLVEFGEKCFPTSEKVANQKFAEVLGQVNSIGYRQASSTKFNARAAAADMRVGSFQHALERTHEETGGEFYELTTAKNVAAKSLIAGRVNDAVHELAQKMPMDEPALHAKFDSAVNNIVSDRCSPQASKEVLGVDAAWRRLADKNGVHQATFVQNAVASFDKSMHEVGHAQVDCQGASRCTFHEMPAGEDFLAYTAISEFLNSEERGKSLVEDARHGAQSGLAADKTDAAEMLRNLKVELVKREEIATAQHVAHHLLVVQVQVVVLLISLLIYCSVGRRGRSSGPCRKCKSSAGENCEELSSGRSSKYGKRTKFFV